MKHPILILPFFALAACTASDDVLDTSLPETSLPQQQDDKGILIGTADDLQALTRAETNPPAVADNCTADTVLVRVYRAYHRQTLHPAFTNEEMTFEVDNTMQTGAGTTYNMGNEFLLKALPMRSLPSINATSLDYYTKMKRKDGHDTDNAFAITGLAFRGADLKKGYFSYSPVAEGTRMVNATVDVAVDRTTPAPLAERPDSMATIIHTPDLYFGPINWDGKENLGGLQKLGKLLGSLLPFEVTTERGDNGLMYGHIYRAVSKIVIALRKVPRDAVGVELLATQVPTHMGLYGDHGGPVGGAQVISNWNLNVSYPLAAANASQCTDAASGLATISYVRFAETTEPFVNVTMSSYMLPSTVGRQLWLRVWYNVAGERQYRDFRIKPQNSAVLTGQNANYTVPAAVVPGASPRQLYVYDSQSRLFYSYANVRLTLNADFDRVAAEQRDITATLDIEPAFVKRHDFNAQ